MEGGYVDDKMIGTWTVWHENGKKMQEVRYGDGKRMNN
jgi:antitoxin component YwqK of YwqJK toxin-antitoxin module